MTIMDHYGCKQVLKCDLPNTRRSIWVSTELAVNGGNDLFGESVSLVDFIKVRTDFEFCLCFPWLATSHCSSSCAFMVIYMSRS